MMIPTIHVIFRVCDVVNAVNKQPRPFNLSKADLIKICFKSLYKSIQNVPHTITVLGDKLSPEMVLFFDSYNVKFSNGNYGNDASIRKSLEIALDFENDNDWIYFCEDDYLHRVETFSFILNAIKMKSHFSPTNLKSRFLFLMQKKDVPNIAIFPCDYPDRYLPNDRTQHFIFHTNDCHWRQVANTTFTFLLQLKDVRKYKDVILAASNNADDAYLSKMLFGINDFKNKLLCIAPMPSLTAHMHVDILPPLIDWQSMIEKINDN